MFFGLVYGLSVYSMGDFKAKNRHYTLCYGCSHEVGSTFWCHLGNQKRTSEVQIKNAYVICNIYKTHMRYIAYAFCKCCISHMRYLTLLLEGFLNDHNGCGRHGWYLSILMIPIHTNDTHPCIMLAPCIHTSCSFLASLKVMVHGMIWVGWIF